MRPIVSTDADFESRRRIFLLFIGLSVLFLTSALWWPAIVSVVWEPSSGFGGPLRVLLVYGPLFGSVLLAVDGVGVSCHHGLGCLAWAGLLYGTVSILLAFGTAMGLKHRIS